MPNLPGLLLQNGEYDKSLNVMIGHNANEGLLFTSPFIQNNSAFTNELVSTLPTLRAWPNTVDYIVNTLYRKSGQKRGRNGAEIDIDYSTDL